MVSTDKLIKVGVQYTDKYFEDLIQLYIRAYKDSMSLEEFLDETSDYSIGNPLEANGYKDTLTNLIVASTNDIRFSRPAQKALMNNIIRQTTGELITNVGDDVKSSVRDIVRRGYNTGTLSHQNVAKEITSTLDGINKKRARTIARTEIKRAQTTSNYMVAKERGANAYKYKCGAKPCDICKKDCGETFPIDDLDHLPPRHPNCICGVTFFKDPNMPDAKPSPTTDTSVPPDEQLKTNLSKGDMEMVDWARNILKNPKMGTKQKNYAQKRLDELYQKALGTTETIEKPQTKPKTTSKSKKTSSQPNTSVDSMTSQELYESMTKADKKKYDKAKKGLENVNKNLEQLGESKLLLDIKKKNLLEIQELEQKQREKLQNKGKRKPKKEPTVKYDRTLDNIYKEVDLPLEKLIPTLEKWIDKRCKNTSEFGYHFNISNGEIIDGLKNGEIRGMKGRISMRDLGEKTGSIHSHPRNGMAAPSIEDLETFRCKKQNHHFMVSEHEIWYVHATDNFGIGAMGQQLDLQKAHKECRDRAFDRVSEDIKKDKIKATEDEIRVKLDEYTGEEILKTFNSPPWSDTMVVKRYYR